MARRPNGIAVPLGEGCECCLSVARSRLYLGARVGPHGLGFLRPFLGGNLAAVIYNIDSSIHITDVDNPENTVSKGLSNETRAVFGYDLSGGLDFNFFQKIAVEGGVRYLKSLSVPQQLREDALVR